MKRCGATASRVVAPDEPFYSPRNCGTGTGRLTDRLAYGRAFAAWLSAGGHDVDSGFVWACVAAGDAADCGMVALPFASRYAPETRSDRRLQYSMVCEAQSGHIKVAATA